MNIWEKHPELGEGVFRKSPLKKIISGADGEIYDANDAFCKFIGYSVYEFQRSNNPVKWTELTLPTEDLEADTHNVEMCLEGKQLSYRVRKHYIPKGETPVLVEIHVTRFPFDLSKPFEFFVVSVLDIEGKDRILLEEFTQITKKQTQIFENQTKSIEDIANELKILRWGNVSTIIKWCIDNPKWSFPFFVLVVILLTGDRLKVLFDSFFSGG